MKVKTSITLPDDLIRMIDRAESNRSVFLEKAARKYLADAATADRRRRDAAILDRAAAELNREAEDVLEYQAIPD